MVGVFGREQREVLSVEADAVEMIEVGIAPLLVANAQEVEQAVVFVNTQQLAHIPFAARDLAFELASSQIIEIKVAPVIALGKPDYLIGRREIVPVDAPISGFV